ncbi:hypothetical protein MHY87_08265 [Microvirga sp. ACRRW]|nr:hypothetical protein [Microvirga sp. ACRRW]MCG7392895.1 hypothetical protein [Microvirga sp. ACRRW]
MMDTTDDKSHSVGSKAEEVCLPLQASQTVSIALDLHARQSSVHDGKIHTGGPSRCTKFLDDDSIIISVPFGQELSDGSSNHSVISVDGGALRHSRSPVFTLGGASPCKDNAPNNPFKRVSSPKD